jgi:hypothetical protein
VSSIITCRLPRDVLAALDRYVANVPDLSRSAAVAQILRRSLQVAEPPPKVGQNRDSGAVAVAFGRKACAAIAERLGLTPEPGTTANLYRQPDRRRLLLKNARGLGNRINVLPDLLDRFDVLYAGFWNESGTRCELFEVPADLFERNASPVTGGKFRQIKRAKIEQLGLRPTVLAFEASSAVGSATTSGTQAA